MLANTIQQTRARIYRLWDNGLLDAPCDIREYQHSQAQGLGCSCSFPSEKEIERNAECYFDPQVIEWAEEELSLCIEPIKGEK